MSNVLLVEDSGSAMRQAREALEASGHTVTTANTVSGAISLLEMYDENDPKKFDVTVLDANFPLDSERNDETITDAERRLLLKIGTPDDCPVIGIPERALHGTENDGGNAARRVLAAMQQLDILHRMKIIGFSSLPYDRYNLHELLDSSGGFIDAGKRNVTRLGEIVLALTGAQA